MSIFYFIAAFVFLVAATLCFKANLPHRDAINSSMAIGEEMKTPERMIPYYDAGYLNRFVKRARQQQTAIGRYALDLYIRPTLLWIDVGFAIFCAAFAAFFWIGILEVLPSHQWLKNLLGFMIVMSVSYGVIDVAEDLWLVRLFSKHSEVTKLEGAIACALTETKIATISLSLVGGLLFKVLDMTLSRAASPS